MAALYHYTRCLAVNDWLRFSAGISLFALLVFCSGIAKMAVAERQGKGSASLSAKGKHLCGCTAGSTGCKEKYAGRKRQSERITFTGLPHCPDYWFGTSFSFPSVGY